MNNLWNKFETQCALLVGTILLAALLQSCAQPAPPVRRIHWLHTQHLDTYGRTGVHVDSIFYNLDEEDRLWELTPRDFRVVVGNDELPPSRYEVAYTSTGQVEVRFTRPLDMPARVTLAAMIAVEPCLGYNNDPGLRSVSPNGYRSDCWMD
jgi:hypothetical protein